LNRKQFELFRKIGNYFTVNTVNPLNFKHAQLFRMLARYVLWSRGW